MANFSWKSLSLLIATLLVALGLQAGAVKIMINLNRQAGPAVATEIRTLPGKPAPSALTALEAERQQVTDPKSQDAGSSVLPVREPLPTTAPSDPPHLAGLPEKPESSPLKPASAAHPPATTTPPAPETPLPAHPTPAPAPGVPTASSPASNPPAATPPSPAVTPPHPGASSDVSDQPGPGAHAAVAPTPTATDTTPSATTTSPEAATGLQEAAWVKARDPKRYTVQLYSGKDLDKLKEIAKTVTAIATPAYFTTSSRSGPWHSLVVGDYPDSKAAQTAAAKITAQAPAIKPWVRRFDEIQAKLR